MGAVRHLRTLALLVLAAGVLAACGNNSSSSSSATDSTLVGDTGGFEIRPVYARYAPGVPFGPEVPKAVLTEMQQQSCPMTARVVQDMLMECDAAKTVYLLRNPIVQGGVTSATAKQIGHKDLWYIEVGLDQTATAAMQDQIKNDVGSELAFVYGGQVVTSIAVDSSLHADHVAVLGDFDKAQATKLAQQIAGA
jgi:preprotein translocase subunit SecD